MPFPLLLPPAPPRPPEFPEFPTAGDPNGSCDIVIYNELHFGDLLGRLFDPTWVQGILATFNGTEIAIAAMRMGARQSFANFILGCGNLLAYALPGKSALGGVNFSRPTAVHGAVTIKAGTVVGTSRTGRTYATIADLAFGPLELGPLLVKVLARSQDYQHEVQGEVITAAGEVLPPEIDTIVTWIQDPPFTDPTFTVLGSAKEGQFPDIDLLGLDRGLPRTPGESTPAYRLRLRSLPDTISRGAVQRNARSILAPLGAPFEVVEAHEYRLSGCWDAPSSNVGTPTFFAVLPPADYGFNTNGFSYDDPLNVPAFRSRWLDEVSFRGMVLVLVPRWAAILDLGGAYDDIAVTIEDHQRMVGTVLGTRAHAAYDVPSDYTSANGFGLAYDGFDLGARAVHLALYNLLQQIKAAGVFATLEHRT